MEILQGFICIVTAKYDNNILWSLRADTLFNTVRFANKSLQIVDINWLMLEY